MKGFLTALSKVSVDLQAGSLKKRALVGAFFLIASLYDGWSTIRAIHTGTVYYWFAHAPYPIHMATSPDRYWMYIVGDSMLSVLFLGLGLLILKDVTSAKAPKGVSGDS